MRHLPLLGAEGLWLLTNLIATSALRGCFIQVIAACPPVLSSWSYTPVGWVALHPVEFLAPPRFDPHVCLPLGSPPYYGPEAFTIHVLGVP